MLAGPSMAIDALPVSIEFSPPQLIVGKDTDIRLQLSGIALAGDHLWLGCDEGCRLERLTRAVPGAPFEGHEVFQLHDLLPMPAPAKEEADIEGLHVDEDWLWLVGSHGVKRKKPKGDAPADVASRLAETERDGNRHLLARLPLAAGRPQKVAGDRRAAMLPATTTSSALLDAIRAARDPHLLPFLDLPGKDNGFDIEGLAARGMRVWIGLRGPVLREWCCVLELRLAADGERLELQAGPDGALYRKHFMKLGGLGVRDLAIAGDDLLILAGPTMAHEGPGEIWRWTNGAREGASVSADALHRLAALPQAGGFDKAEGMTLYDTDAAGPQVLVVFDNPAPERLIAPSSVRADVYRLA
jgi:hypothetical protein